MHTNSKQTGIYIIRCHVNNFVYIGSAASHKGFKGRLRFHLWQLEKGIHHSPILQNHFNKYGRDAFSFEIVLVCPPNKCTDFEQAFIDAIGVGYQNKSYNINPSVKDNMVGRTRTGINKNIGRKVSEETRRKLSEALKGRIFTSEHRANIGATSKGRKMPPDAIARRSAKLRGRKLSPLRVEALRQWNLTHPLSPEVRERVNQCVANANSKEYVVTSPEGEEIAIKNLKAFCGQHGLTHTHMIRCAQGLTPFHKGWKCRYAHTTRVEQEEAIARLTQPKHQYLITAPDGTEHHTTEISRFCEQHRLNLSAMCMVAKGQKRHYKGWICKTVDEPEEITVKRNALKGKTKTFIVTTPQGKEIVVEHLNNFCAEHQLSSSTMIKVAKGKRPQHKGYLCRYAHGEFS